MFSSCQFTYCFGRIRPIQLDSTRVSSSQRNGKMFNRFSSVSARSRSSCARLEFECKRKMRRRRRQRMKEKRQMNEESTERMKRIYTNERASSSFWDADDYVIPWQWIMRIFSYEFLTKTDSLLSFLLCPFSCECFHFCRQHILSFAEEQYDDLLPFLHFFISFVPFSCHSRFTNDIQSWKIETNIILTLN